MQLNRVTHVHNLVPLRNALVSVADKSGLETFLDRLWSLAPGLTVYATGGTLALARSVAQGRTAPPRVVPLSEYTGQPEMQGGLVKSLDWRVYLGLLGESFNPAHKADLEKHNAVAFDLTVCNFYPFQSAVEQKNATIEDARTHIDIGGPTMIRASAKNYLRIATICSPGAYDSFLDHVTTNNGATTLEFRYSLMKEAFQYVAAYDNAISSYFEHENGEKLSVYEEAP